MYPPKAICRERQRRVVSFETGATRGSPSAGPVRTVRESHPPARANPRTSARILLTVRTVICSQGRLAASSIAPAGRRRASATLGCTQKGLAILSTPCHGRGWHASAGPVRAIRAYDRNRVVEPAIGHSRGLAVAAVGSGRRVTNDASQSRPGRMCPRRSASWPTAGRAHRYGTVPTWMVTIPPDIGCQVTLINPASCMIAAIRSGSG